MTRVLVRTFTALIILLGAASSALSAKDGRLNVYLFWQEGCPYCERAHADLRSISAANPQIEFKPHKLGTKREYEKLYEASLSHFGYQQAAVPLVIIGERSFLGYFEGGHSTRQYNDAIGQCLKHGCPDVVAGLANADLGKVQMGQSPAGGWQTNLLPTVIDVPLIGRVTLTNLSLPVLTVLLAAIDGFNPCAMWVLVFLIGLLLGLEQERRMWLLGGAFLAATAVMYFAVMTAWLNLVLFLGAVVWVRVAISLLAIGGGFYFLREFWTKPEAVCHVASPGRRQRIMAAFRAIVQQNQLVLAMAGIMVLAVLVNFIELLCSAGIPAVYTQILAMNHLSLAANYAYVGLYVAVFMVDDIAIFATAMIALRVAGLTGAYARYSHLIGGVVLLTIGAVMLLRPELLSFA